MSSSSQRKTRSGMNSSSEIPTLEWVVGALGLLIVLAAVGVLIFEATVGDNSPPDVKLTVQSIVERPHGFLVKIRAENIGGEPAASVGISAELMEKEAVLETSSLEFDYLPAHSTRDAGIFFQRDPRDKQIRLQARGYEVP